MFLRNYDDYDDEFDDEFENEIQSSLEWNGSGGLQDNQVLMNSNFSNQKKAMTLMPNSTSVMKQTPSDAQEATGRRLEMRNPSQYDSGFGGDYPTYSEKSERGIKEDSSPVNTGILTIPETPQTFSTTSGKAEQSPEESSNAPPPALTKQQLRQFEEHLVNLGQKNSHIVQMALSPNWMHRMQALYHLKSFLESLHYSSDSLDGKKLGDKLQSCSYILSLLLRDKILKVYIVAVEVVEPLLRASESLGSLTVRNIFQPIALSLLHQLANKTKKYVKEAENCFDHLCSQNLVGIKYVAGHLTKFDKEIPEDQKKALAISYTNQLSLLCVLTTKYGLSNDYDSFDPNQILSFTLQVLEAFSFDQQTKNAAANLFVIVYKFNSKLCNLQLKSLDLQLQKFLLSHLEKNDQSVNMESINNQTLLQEVSSDDLEDLRELTREESDKLQSHLKILGLVGVKNIFSKKWSKRNDVILHLTTLTKAGDVFEIANPVIVRHLIELAALGLNDTNPTVIVSSIKLLRILLCEQGYKLSGMAPIVLQDLLRKHVISHISSKIGHMNAHVNKQCRKVLIDFSRSEKIGSRFVADILQSHEQEFELKQWKNIAGRLSIFSELIDIHGFSDGISMEKAVTHIISSFSSPNAQVRQEAVNAIVSVYKKAGNVIQTYLKNQKPALMKELRDRIAAEAQDTSSVSPIHHLASIVRPFGFEDQFSSPKSTVERNSIVDKMKSPIKGGPTMRDTLEGFDMNRQGKESALGGYGSSAGQQDERKSPSKSRNILLGSDGNAPRNPFNVFKGNNKDDEFDDDEFGDNDSEIDMNEALGGNVPLSSQLTASTFSSPISIKSSSTSSSHPTKKTRLVFS